MKKRALSVGNCAMDEATFRRVLDRQFGAELIAVDTAADALEALRSEKFDLVLVNRVFDIDGEPGLALIERIRSDGAFSDLPVMLISNYPDFQAQAEKVGAVPGVGKSTLSTMESLERLAAYLKPNSTD